MDNQSLEPGRETQTPSVSPGNYSPVTVTVKDSLGTIFLGILAGILLIGLVRSEERYRTLLTQMEAKNVSRLPNSG